MATSLTAASGNLTNNDTSYNADRASSSGEPDTSNDPASGSFFHADFKRHEDLRNMLDTTKDSLKLEAMKRIIAMVAKGKDASDLFPAVVKNVVCKNIEVKKLVYVYLVRYAEEQQDLALLSISTFQRALKDPNQLIRASALRVLSSIRVQMIVPIMMLAIKDSVSDMSPYVRKTAAHAIPKLYNLDAEQKDELVGVIEKLLQDKTTLVAGSVVMAFDEVCPERIDLIHRNFRKLCNLLVDVEEWGQVLIINMLTRYARTQFINPNDLKDENNTSAFYESDKEDKMDIKLKVMDKDHRLLLRVAKPLLQSRNAAVVMSVVQLYYHLAPKSEVGIIAKPLVRLIKSHREVQSVVLSNIASITTERRGMFEPYLKSFFARPMDPTHIRLLKLEILTNLATETTISTILREFQTYVSNSDKEFVAATIQAIGRCASSISDVTDTCMNGLVNLMSNRDETVVAESVVVIKKLLQTDVSKHKDIIIHMAKLMDKITVPMARASILWLIGEYCEKVPKIAPDVLRKVAKTFTTEEDIVKLQVLNLATKLLLTNPKQTQLVAQYVFNLAKYDQNYDIRDRARFLRQLVLPSSGSKNTLTKYAKKIFLSAKPAPVLQSKFKDRDNYQLGSLSHFLNQKTNGYQELADFPEVAPDADVRDIEEIAVVSTSKSVAKTRAKKQRGFYSDSSSSVDEDSDEEESSDESSDEDEDDSTETESSEEEEVEEADKKKKQQKKKSEADSEEESSEEEDDSEYQDSDESSESEEESSEEEPVKQIQKKKPASKKEANLLDLDDAFVSVPSSTLPVLNPSETLLTPTAPALVTASKQQEPSFATISAFKVITSTEELLNRMQGGGLSATYRFTRNVHIYSPKMVSIEVRITNNTGKQLKKIYLKTGSKLQPGMEIHNFPDITKLDDNETASATVGIDFADTVQAASFDLCVGDLLTFPVSIKGKVGEILQPITITQNDFAAKQTKLKGMHENAATVSLPLKNCGLEVISAKVHGMANLAAVPYSDSPKVLRFAAQTLSAKALVLVTIKQLSEDKATQVTITVNCEKITISSMLLKDIKTKLTSI